MSFIIRARPSEDKRRGVGVIMAEEQPRTAAPPHPHYISPNRDEGLNEVIAIQWTQISPGRTVTDSSGGEVRPLDARRSLGGGIGRCARYDAHFMLCEEPLSQVGFIWFLRG